MTNQAFNRPGQGQDESEAAFLEREKAHVAEIEKRRKLLLSLRERVEQRFGKGAEVERD